MAAFIEARRKAPCGEGIFGFHVRNPYQLPCPHTGGGIGKKFDIEKTGRPPDIQHPSRRLPG